MCYVLLLELSLTVNHAFYWIWLQFELMKGFLKPILGGNIIDASCASGLFSRLFAKSGLFSFVVALDYSENMLQQCYEFIQKEENFPKEYTVYISKLIRTLLYLTFEFKVLMQLFKSFFYSYYNHNYN